MKFLTSKKLFLSLCFLVMYTEASAQFPTRKNKKYHKQGFYAPYRFGGVAHILGPGVMFGGGVEIFPLTKRYAFISKGVAIGQNEFPDGDEGIAHLCR